MRKFLSVRSLLVLLFFAGAAWLLYRELRQYSVADIRAGFAVLPTRNIVWAALFTVVSYVILVGYDWLAVRSIGHPLALGRIVFASFCGHAVSYNFGALLGGGSIRARLYAAWGLTALDIVRLLAMMGITFWVGAFALGGAAFLIDPLAVPPELPLPFETVRPLGVLLLAIVAAYLSISLVRTRPIEIRGRTFLLPTFRLSLAQITIAAVDIIVAAAVLYAVLPPALEISFARFLSVYLLGVVAVLFTHVPGGVGVFELVILTLLDAAHPEYVVSSLLVFRAIYYLVPLLIAAVLLGLHELRLAAPQTERVPEPANLPGNEHSPIEP